MWCGTGCIATRGRASQVWRMSHAAAVLPSIPALTTSWMPGPVNRRSVRATSRLAGRWACFTSFLALRFRLCLSRSTVRRLLHGMDWRWTRPRLAPASLLRRKRDPDAAVKLAAIEHAKAMAAQGLAHLLYLDESGTRLRVLHLLPVIRAMWMKGERVRVPTPGQNARHAFFGALDAASGVFHWVDHDRKLAVYFVAFLDHLVTVYPDGPISLVLDSAPTHTAKVVQRWLLVHPRVQILWLPKYTAHEVNPVERIWGLMKDKVAANRLAGHFDGLVAQARRFFGELAPHPVALPAAA